MDKIDYTLVYGGRMENCIKNIQDTVMKYAEILSEVLKVDVEILDNHFRQKKLGLDPVFIPERIGITNATLWHKITDRHYKDLLNERGEGEKKAV